MAIIQAEFDGQVFIPCQPVQLPKGARVGVLIPDIPPPPTAEQQTAWDQLLRQIQASEPAFASVDEALDYTRKRP
ncbi:MAG: antitoxin family protein [Planctomycetia bacterium]|nr:antitoxin family protein [Planctomycetia bacterium]